jgi:hypothetical protein
MIPHARSQRAGVARKHRIHQNGSRNCEGRRENIVRVTHSYFSASINIDFFVTTIKRE